MGRMTSFLRRSPRGAEVELDGRAFAFVAHDEPRGWTVTAYDGEGRRLGRPLKGMSSAGRATLVRSLDGATDAQLEQLADVWVQTCRQSMTNAAVLTSFADAAGAIRGDGEAASPG